MRKFVLFVVVAAMASVAPAAQLVPVPDSQLETQDQSAYVPDLNDLQCAVAMQSMASLANQMAGIDIEIDQLTDDYLDAIANHIALVDELGAEHPMTLAALQEVQDIAAKIAALEKEKKKLKDQWDELGAWVKEHCTEDPPGP